LLDMAEVMAVYRADLEANALSPLNGAVA